MLKKMSPSLDPAVESRMVELLERELSDLELVYLFGSHAQGLAHRDSDLDLAFLAKTKTDLRRRIDLAGKLSREAGHTVDLVDLRTAPTVLKMQIVSSGRRLFEDDPLERARFENWVFKSYALLNEERAAILEDVRQRGSIYG